MSSIAERQDSKIAKALPDRLQSRTIYRLILIALFGLAIIGLPVAGSFYNIFEQPPYVGP